MVRRVFCQPSCSRPCLCRSGEWVYVCVYAWMDVFCGGVMSWVALPIYAAFCMPHTHNAIWMIYGAVSENDDDGDSAVCCQWFLLRNDVQNPKFSTPLTRMQTLGTRVLFRFILSLKCVCRRTGWPSSMCTHYSYILGEKTNPAYIVCAPLSTHLNRILIEHLGAINWKWLLYYYIRIRRKQIHHLLLTHLGFTFGFIYS